MTKRKILTVVLLAAGYGTAAANPSTSATPASPPPAVAPDSAQPPARIELRAQLYRAGKPGDALAMERFRALCDAEGFPLVGNVANKGVRYRVAEYCSDVRTAARRDA